MLKRFTALLIILASLLIMTPSSGAAATVIFTVFNDQLVGTPTKDAMPVKIGGQPYVPFEILTNLDLKTIYNETLQRLMVFNFDYVLTFDLAGDRTYDDTGVSYAYRAVRRGGTVFVPASLVAQRFSMTYSLINSTLGQIVRINSEKSYYRDIDILNDNKYGMQKLYDDYQTAVEAPNKPPEVKPPTTDTPEQPTTPGQPVAVKKIAYFAFDGGIGENTEKILDDLKKYGYKAAFFLTESDILDYGDTVRRIYAEGHSIGVQCIADLENEEAVFDNIEQTNTALKNVIYTKSRLLWMGGKSKTLTRKMRDSIIESGMRIWDSNIEPKSDNSSTGTIRVNAINMLSRTSRSAVVRMRQNKAAANALPGILAFVKKENYTILPIREWDAPINKVREMR